jgi:Plasmid pRiA4b ORF-3-like protein
MVDERRVQLHQVVPGPARPFRYEYDFGDGWEHAVVVERVLEPMAQPRFPVCLDGKRACQPEDVGGPEGYRLFLAALRNPQGRAACGDAGLGWRAL